MSRHLFAPGETVSYCGVATIESNARWKNSEIICYSCANRRLDKTLYSTRRLIKTFYWQSNRQWGLQTKLAKLFGISRQRVHQIVYDPDIKVFDVEISLVELKEAKEKEWKT
jgi:hypothetical protein